jgi:hypothetical protein
MLSKVVVAYIDVLCAWMESWESDKFIHQSCSQDLAIHIRLCIDYVEFTIPHLFGGFHEGNDVTNGHRHDITLCYHGD